MGDRPAKDETSRFDPRDFVDLGPGIGVNELIHGAAEGLCIPKQGSYVAKEHSCFRVIRNGADCSKKRLFQ